LTIEKLKIQGLAKIAAWIFFFWGVPVALKGVYDLLWGAPEANLYAPNPWGFISREDWRRYGVFEAVYGLACIGTAVYLSKFARFLPKTISRKIQDG